MRIAAASYPCERHESWRALAAKLDRWVAEAAADLVVFPEYAGLEAALVGAPDELSPVDWRDRAAGRADDWAALHADLARRHGCHVLAGSMPARAGATVVNRAWLCAPGGGIGVQDKLIPTPYERSEMGIAGGEGLRVFDTALGRVGVLVCYDSEFPLLGRALVEAGADMILVPSCTDMPQGQTRVRTSCRARAVEGQCLVVQAPLVGEVPGCGPIDTSTGRAGLFCPPDIGLPETGILAQGETDRPGWTSAEIEPGSITAARESGQVGNVAHWPEQDGRIASTGVVPLR